MDPKLVDSGGSLIEQLGNWPRGRDRIKGGRGAKPVGIGVHPDARNFLLLANEDWLNRPPQHDRDIDLVIGGAATGVNHGAEQQQLRTGEAVADLDLPRRHVRNQHRLVGGGERDPGDRKQQGPKRAAHR